MQTITCYGCELPLSEEHFTPGIWARGRGRCRPCQKAYGAAFYAANREKYLERMKVNNLLRLYGLTPEAYEELAEAQDHRCAICGAESGWRHRQSGKLKKLAVDHCRKTGRIRGLLCDRCNTAIGKLDHDPDLLQKAIEYLR
jgi:hypothetical protein